MEPVAKRRIKPFICDRRFVLGNTWVGQAVAEYQRRAGQHFVQRDRSGITLGMQVPSRRFAISEEGIEIRSRACLDVLGWCTAEREVEQHETVGPSASGFGDADVVRLDVAMRY